MEPQKSLVTLNLKYWNGSLNSPSRFQVVPTAFDFFFLYRNDSKGSSFFVCVRVLNILLQYHFKYSCMCLVTSWLCVINKRTDSCCGLLNASYCAWR